MKKYIYPLIALLLLVAIHANAQENLIHDRINLRKSQGVTFRALPTVFVKQTEQRQFSEHFHDLNQVSFLQYRNLPTESLGEAIIFSVPLVDQVVQLELLEVEESFYEYTVVTSDGQRNAANKKLRHYRGIVSGDPKSMVAISFLENEVMGLIATDQGNFNLALDLKSRLHLLYNDRNLVKKPDFTCGTTSDNFKPYSTDVLLQQSKLTTLSAARCVRLYFETEHDIFTTRGSVASVESFVAGLFNQVATLYQNENILTALSQIFVWTSSDPFSASTAQLLLTEFQNTRTSFNGALGQLLTFRNINGGWAGSINGLCSPNIRERLSVAGIDNSYQTVPTFSNSVQVVTHEFGHLFGSRHTHACVWNGNNTAIDGCAGATEPAIPGGIPCPLPGNPPGGGTIMSYCHWATGINFNLGFGLQPGNVIRDNVNNSATCVCACPSMVGPNTLCASSATYSITNVPAGSTVTWASSNSSILSINSSSGLATRIGNGPVTITATITSVCGENIVMTRIVEVGTPAYNLIVAETGWVGSGQMVISQ